MKKPLATKAPIRPMWKNQALQSLPFSNRCIAFYVTNFHYEYYKAWTIEEKGFSNAHKILKFEKKKFSVEISSRVIFQFTDSFIQPFSFAWSLSGGPATYNSRLSSLDSLKLKDKFNFVSFTFHNYWLLFQSARVNQRSFRASFIAHSKLSIGLP